MAYLRVSTPGQGETGESGLPRQLAAVHEVATREGYSIAFPDVYADMASGFTDDRPALKAMRQAYRKGVPVFIEKGDRLSREGEWLLGFLIKEMEGKGVPIIAYVPLGNAITRTVTAVVEQLAMEDSKARMKDGKDNKAMSGYVPGGHNISFGYNWSADRKTRTYVINEREASTVRLVFNLVAQGHTIRQVIERLYDQGIAPRNKKVWAQPTVWRMIRNAVYRGDYIWHKVGTKDHVPDEIHVPVPAIVTPDLWHAANERMSANYRYGGRGNQKHEYLLVGLIKCACCGYSYGGRLSGNSTKTYRYVCTVRYSKIRQISYDLTCDNPQVVASKIEAAVWKAVTTALLEPDLILKALDSDETRAATLAQIAHIEAEIADATKRDGKVTEGYLAGVFDAEQAASERKAIKERKARLNEALDTLRERMVSVEQHEARKAMILEIAAKARKTDLSNAPFELKRRLLITLVDKVIVDARVGTFVLEGKINGVFDILSS